MPAILEQVVESAAEAAAAERGGASRLELCVRLEDEGLTPPDLLIRDVIGSVRCPVFVMIRPRPGDFVYSDAEQTAMLAEIARARRAGAHGIVIGALTPRRQVDGDATRRFVDAADGLPVTFHRAFDATADPLRSLDDAIDAGVARVLTSGGAATAVGGMAVLADLVRRAGDRAIVVAAGRVRSANVGEILVRTGAREVHARFESEARTRQLVDLL